MFVLLRERRAELISGSGRSCLVVNRKDFRVWAAASRGRGTRSDWEVSMVVLDAIRAPVLGL